MCRRMQPKAIERLKEILDDLHETFKDTVRQSRKGKLHESHEVWTGRVWTGRQAEKLGLVDGVGTMHDIMRSKYGEKVLICHIVEPCFQPCLPCLTSHTVMVVVLGYLVSWQPCLRACRSHHRRSLKYQKQKTQWATLNGLMTTLHGS